jgi:polyphosphate kinase 2 (PPK2 family)
VAAVDPRQYQIIPVSAPDASAHNHHWLWRFWRHVPKAGHLTIFDRSWYGRVLVERVEGFASEPFWCRAFEEINEFERQLAEHGVVVAKFWLHLSSEEQGRRFEARRQTPHKRHKITDEDLRNRLRRPDYERALVDMFRHTDTSYAPWHGIAAEDKRFARVEVLERATRLLNEALYAHK